MREPDDMVAVHFRRCCETLDRAADDMRPRTAIYAIADAITQVFRNGGKLMLAGNGEREMSAHSDYYLAAPATETPLIQQIHIVAAHAICGLVERNLFGSGAAGAAR